MTAPERSGEALPFGAGLEAGADPDPDPGPGPELEFGQRGGAGEEPPVWGHWIGGELVHAGSRSGSRAAAGNTFELRPGGPGSCRVGPFPSADADQLEAALAGAERAAGRWTARSPAERRRCLTRALELVGEVPAAPSSGAFLGLSPTEDAVHRDPQSGARSGSRSGSRSGWGTDLATRVERAVSSRCAPGLVLIAPHWTDLTRGIGARLLPELAAGRGALLLSDSRLPQPAEAWLQALERAGVEPGLVALLHGAGPALRARAAGDTRIAAITASGSAAELDRLELALESGSAGSHRATEIHFDPVRARARLIRIDGDPVAGGREAGRALGRGLWDRGATLSGQLPGGTTRVLCPELAYSAFTEALLLELEREPLADPVPLVDSSALAAATALWELGLDEGATLVSGGERCPEGARRAGDRRVQGTLFTNVEPHMQLARWRTPGPVLCLLRVPRGVAGAELLERIG